MKIFLDFDDTIFETCALVLGVQEVFEKAGISRELYSKAYEELKADFPAVGWCYSFKGHMEKLKKYVSFDEEKLTQSLEEYMTSADQFLFPDTLDFLTSFQEPQSQIIILSFGDPAYQTAKIAGTGIKPYLKKIIITKKDKAEALRDEIDEASSEVVWFLDDRAHFMESVKQALPMVRTIFVQRPTGSYPEEQSTSCDYQVANLEEAKKIILLNS